MMFTFRSGNGLSRLCEVVITRLLAGPVAAQQQSPVKPPPQTAPISQTPVFDELSPPTRTSFTEKSVTSARLQWRRERLSIRS
jgi:hypothetical protein